jgi:two-component system invasion response regulator UvrY
MKAMREEIRVLIADDSDLFRQALASFVADLPGILVVGMACHGEEALELAPRLRADVVLMDARMPGIGGLAATRLLKQTDRPPGVVLVTSHCDERLHEEARRAGVDAVLLKRDVGAQIHAMIRAYAPGPRRGRQRRARRARPVQ